MARNALSFDNIATADIWIIAIAIVTYVIMAWIPCFISLYLVYNRPNDKRSEKEFDQKWYKWKKQYIWHEVAFRTHVIFILALIVIISFEDFPLAAAFSLPIGFILVAVFLKYVSKKVENRVPSDDEKKLLYQSVTGTMRSVSDAREYISEINDEIGSKEQIHSNSAITSTTTKNGENGSNGTEYNMQQGIELQQRNEKHHD